MELFGDDLLNLDDDRLSDIVDEIIKTNSDKCNDSGIWMVDIKGVRDIKQSFHELKDCIIGDGVHMGLTMFDPELELGVISITCRNGSITCVKTDSFVSACRRGRGVDILAHTDGQTEIMLGFNTAIKVGSKL